MVPRAALQVVMGETATKWDAFGDVGRRVIQKANAMQAPMLPAESSQDGFPDAPVPHSA